MTLSKYISDKNELLGLDDKIKAELKEENLVKLNEYEIKFHKQLRLLAFQIQKLKFDEKPGYSQLKKIITVTKALLAKIRKFYVPQLMKSA